jgi:hypothetical protein
MWGLGAEPTARNSESTELLTARARVGTSDRDRRRAIVETALAAALWIVVASLMGPVAFVFAYVLPLVVANIVVMSFIVTNHALGPATTDTSGRE